VTRAHILLQAAEAATDEEIAEALRVGVSTVHRTRQRFVEVGLEGALTERSRCGCGRKLDGKHEAFLVALACSTPPEGRDRWTRQLLADRLVALQRLEPVSDETVRRVLKKRPQAVAEKRMVHSQRRSRIRLAPGGCLGSLRRALRRAASASLF
jgi:transposase